MNRLRVAYQQELSAFGEEAANQLWGGDVDLIPFRDFADIAASVATGAADRGVLPIEHTIVGSVQPSHDAIDGTAEIFAVAETVVPSQLCLLGPANAPLSAVGDVFCHPVAQGQCTKFFRTHPRITVHSILDTGASVLDVENLADPQFAVVASRVALLTHQLTVVAPDIQDRPDAQTRFVGISVERQSLPDGTASTYAGSKRGRRASRGATGSLLSSIMTAAIPKSRPSSKKCGPPRETFAGLAPSRGGMPGAAAQSAGAPNPSTPSANEAPTTRQRRASASPSPRAR